MSLTALSPSDQPLFYATLAFSAGILIGRSIWRPPEWWLLLAVLLLAAAAMLLRKNATSLHSREDAAKADGAVRNEASRSDANSPRQISSSPIIAFWLALFALVPLAALQVQVAPAAEPHPADDSAFTNGAKSEVVAHVVRASLLRPEDDRHRRQTLDVETESIGGHPLVAGMRLTLHSIDSAADPGSTAENDVESSANPSATDDVSKPSPPASPLYTYGDRIRFTARIRRPRNYGNPGAMDYEGYLRGNGITLLAAVPASRVEKLDGYVGAPLAQLRSRMRRALVERMLAMAQPAAHLGANVAHARWWNMNEEEAGLLAAMVIGEQSLLQRGTRLDFQRTGTFHILVVSGMNVAILAFVIFWLAKRLHAGEVAATFITIVLSLLYAYMTDLGTPILRAAFMLAFYLAARLLFRDRYSLNSIGASALVLLVAAPSSLLDASFQFTFLSVIVLGGVIQPLMTLTTEPFRRALSGIEIIGYDMALEPRLAQFRLDLRLLAGRLGGFIVALAARFSGKALHLDAQRSRRVALRAEVTVLRLGIALFDLFTVSSIMQLAMALPMVVYFHRMALTGLPANLAVVPLTSVLMPVGIAASLLMFVSVTVARVPVAVTAIVLHVIHFAVAKLGGMRFADLRLAQPAPWLAFLCGTALFAAVLFTRKRPALAWASVAAVGFAAVALFIPSREWHSGSAAEITVIDVGQGDSILVITPRGRSLLIDGGGPVGMVRSDSFDTGEDVVSPYLWSRGIHHLDAVALTHAHSDHISGLRSVIANFRPAELWIGEDPATPAFRALLADADAFHARVLHFHRGDSIAFGDAQFAVLAPDAHMQLASRPRNDDSLVLEFRYRGQAALLSGDMEKRVEHEVAPLAGKVALLKVAHHGSATSTTPQLLAATQPEFAAISDGFRNTYGHPKPQVLARLEAAHARTFRTDTMGAVTFYLDGDSVRSSVAASPAEVPATSEKLTPK